ncbi:deoxyribonuclease IV [Candidatus Sumerlaeota bacterium]|nr:deoxyribonuclease IV [Candidatus Sumerlaeota bacterium]
MLNETRKTGSKTNSRRILLGAHISVAGGVDKAILRGRELNCSAIQIFLKYNTRWQGKPFTQQEQTDFFKNLEDSGIACVLAHNCYLINLASPDDVVYQKSLNAMLDEIERASKLKIKHLIIHPGANLGSGISQGIQKIASSLNLILEKSSDKKVCILLETTAGQGTGIGHRFEELADIRNRIRDKKRIGVCLDTAHIFAAGYDIRTRSAYRNVLKEFDATLGLSCIRAIHINDSSKPLGSRVDRHEHIGKGFIGLDAFGFIMNDERFREVPKILETPKNPGDKYDKRNLRILRNLVR